MAQNPTWGAPRNHGELPGSVWTFPKERFPGASEPGWLVFLRNQREAIAAVGLFTVPTLPFAVLYCLSLISHDRRHILHGNLTRHPTRLWIVQQLREPSRLIPLLGFSFSIGTPSRGRKSNGIAELLGRRSFSITSWPSKSAIGRLLCVNTSWAQERSTRWQNSIPYVGLAPGIR